MLTFRFAGAEGVMTVWEMLTSGMVGKEVKLEFSSDWENIRKTAVFTAGPTTKDVLDVTDTVAIPHEVLQNHGDYLYVGVYGISEDGTQITPTTYARGPKILMGADPSGDEGTNPDLPVWAQLKQEIDDLKANNTGGTQNVDWSVNDEKSPAYVKNRPFYSEISEIEVECAAEQPTALDGFPDFEVGDTVTVKVDGVEYSLVAFDDVCITIGDSYANIESGTGQYGWQFLIYNDVVYFAALEAHTVSYAVEVVHKLDAKFLPNEAVVSKYGQHATAAINFKSVLIGFGIYDGFGGLCIDTAESVELSLSAEKWNEFYTLLNECRDSGILCVEIDYPIHIASANNISCEVMLYAWRSSSDGTFTLKQYSVSYIYNADTATVKCTRTITKSSQI